MANYRRAKKKKATSKNITEQESTVDQLLAFERFREVFAPELQEMLLRKAPVKEILKNFESAVVARAVTIALTEQDSGKALSAIKDLLDRSHGKATETKKIEHSMATIEDKDLDQLLLSAMEDEALEAEFEEVSDETD